MLRHFLHKKPSNKEAVLAALGNLKKRVEAMNIPVIADDQDAGYDMAVDEVLALIDDAINQTVSNTDVDYSGGI